jgi:ESX secretion system protein EccD
MPDTAVMPIVRVAVLASADDGGRMTELALPAALPLREIMPVVQRLALPVDETSDVPVPLSLAPIGGAPFSLDATLDTVGVVDGDLLAVQPLPVGPPAPRIVEDIADAAVIFSAAREQPWGTAHIQRAAVGAVIGLILVVTALPSRTDWRPARPSGCSRSAAWLRPRSSPHCWLGSGRHAWPRRCR